MAIETIEVCLTNEGEDRKTPRAFDLGPAPGPMRSLKGQLVNVPFMHAKPTRDNVTADGWRYDRHEPNNLRPARTMSWPGTSRVANSKQRAGSAGIHQPPAPSRIATDTMPPRIAARFCFRGSHTKHPSG